MSKFSAYATSAAFRLDLSKPQIECLCQIEQTGGSWAYLITSYALQERGLIERRFSDGKWSMRLTDAGEAVIPLLKLAGVYVTIEAGQAAA